MILNSKIHDQLENLLNQLENLLKSLIVTNMSVRTALNNSENIYNYMDLGNPRRQRSEIVSVEQTLKGVDKRNNRLICQLSKIHLNIEDYISAITDSLNTINVALVESKARIINGDD